MSNLKLNEILDKKIDGTTPVDPFAAYVSLMLSLLREPFVSSISKGFIIQGSFTVLKEAGYSDENIEIYRQKIAKIVHENIQVNDFMG